MQLHLAGQGHWREPPEGKPIGLVLQSFRREVQQQRSLQGAMDDNSGIAFGFRRVGLVIVNAMCIERQSGVTEQQY